MKIFPDKVDVLILGAGPAGVCCALRLLKMGYKVGLIEKEIFPRQQIGESLSPGIRNIFSYIQAEHLLENESFLHHVPAEVIWEERKKVFHHPGKTSGGIIVDRSILDAELLKCAVKSGLCLLQPATVSKLNYENTIWKIYIKYGSDSLTTQARIIVDARGRKGSILKERYHTAPSSVALWTHIPARHMPHSTLVEAIEEGWFWGSPVTENKFRIMAFCDGSKIQKNIPQYFQHLIQQTELYNKIENKINYTEIATCSTTSYVANQPWHNQYIKIGEAAFAIDPLSSSGTEKAMRFSLQTAIAINTFLKNEDDKIAYNYYIEKLIESVVSHTQWTAAYYETAWPAQYNNAFWKAKKTYIPETVKNSNIFLQHLNEKLQQVPSPVERKAELPYEWILQKMQHCKIQVAKNISYQTMYSVQDDLVQPIQAIQSAALSSPLGFIEEFPVYQLLSEINNKTVTEVENHFSNRFPMEKMKKMIVFLWQQELIEFE